MKHRHGGGCLTGLGLLPGRVARETRGHVRGPRVREARWSEAPAVTDGRRSGWRQRRGLRQQRVTARRGRQDNVWVASVGGRRRAWAGFAFTAPGGHDAWSGCRWIERRGPISHFSPFTYWYISQSAPMRRFIPYRLEDCRMGSGLCSAGKGSFVKPKRPNEPCRPSRASAPSKSSRFSHWADGAEHRIRRSRSSSIYRAVTALRDELPPVIDAATGTLSASGLR